MKPQAIAALVLSIVLLVGAWMLHHEGYAAGAADAQAALDKEQDANRACTVAIKQVKLKLAQCDADRTVDLAKQTTVTAERNAEEAHAQEVYKAARDDLQRLMRGDCREWAKQPACGSVP